MSEQPIEFVIHEGEHALYFSTSLNFSNTLVSAMNSKHSENGFANTWHDWFIVPTSRPSINQPEVKEERLDLPGGNGDIDLTSVLTGYPVFKNRTGDIEFIAINTNENWALRYSKLASFLNGQKMYMILLDDPLWYYEGRFKVDNWTAGDSWSKVKVSYTLYPYKRSLTKVDEDYLWDTIDFENGIIYQHQFVNHTFNTTSNIGDVFPDVTGPDDKPNGLITSDDISFIQGFLNDDAYRVKDESSWNEYCSRDTGSIYSYPIVNDNIAMTGGEIPTVEDRMLLIEYLDDISIETEVYAVLMTEPSDFTTNYSNYYIYTNGEYVPLDSQGTFAVGVFYKKSSGKEVYILLDEEPISWRETWKHFYYLDNGVYKLLEEYADFATDTYYRKSVIDWSDQGWSDYFDYKGLLTGEDKPNRPNRPLSKPTVDSTDGAFVSNFYSWKQSDGKRLYPDITDEQELWNKYVEVKNRSSSLYNCFPDANNDGIIDSSDATIILNFYSKVQVGAYKNTPRGWLAYKNQEYSVNSRPFPDVIGDDGISEPDGIITDKDIDCIQAFLDNDRQFPIKDEISWGNYVGRDISIDFCNIYNNDFQKYLRFEPVFLSIKFSSVDGHRFSGAKLIFTNTNDGTISDSIEVPAGEQDWIDIPDWVISVTGAPNEIVRLDVLRKGDGYGKFDISFRLGVL